MKVNIFSMTIHVQISEEMKKKKKNLHMCLCLPRSLCLSLHPFILLFHSPLLLLKGSVDVVQGGVLYHY